ncbi:MAG: YtxH domain-containing protein [Gemmatimonadota bacterium]|jgi:gas vesicle protein|nr:MAG: YtxH domain-containing protein [Gemmatimonadota bacterium]
MSRESDMPQIVIERGGSIGPFLWGLATGAVLALLYAPKSGEETQRELKEGARRLRQGAEEKLAELRESAEETYDRVREDVGTRLETAKEELGERKRQAEEALKAGREAAHKTRDDLERRVAESKASYKAEMERVALERSKAGAEPDS